MTRPSWVSAAAILSMLGCIPCHMPTQRLPVVICVCVCLVSPPTSPLLFTVMTHAVTCAGQLEPGASSLSVESGLFRSLAFPYAPPHTDFLLLRTPVSRAGACLVPRTICFLHAASVLRKAPQQLASYPRCNCSSCPL